MQNQNLDLPEKNFLLAPERRYSVETNRRNPTAGPMAAVWNGPASAAMPEPGGEDWRATVRAMPISDTYLVQFLLQETSAASGALQWSEKENGGHATRSRGVRIDLDHVMNRTGTRRMVTLSYEAERVYILEPARTGIFTEQYASEADWMLVQLMRDLDGAASRQCAARRNRGEEADSRIREALYRRLIGAEDSELQRLVSK